MSATARIKYANGLPTDSDTFTIFDTTDNGVSGMLQGGEYKWCVQSIVNSHSGTLKAYWSIDGGTTWHQHYTSGALAAPAAGSSNDAEQFVEHYLDWKLEWLNGGVTQTTFDVAIALSDERSAAL